MARFHRSVILIVVVSVLAGLAAACATKSIRHVQADPSRYRNQEVTISGRVIDSFSIAGRGVYHVEDDTGRIWVLSDHGVPRTGAQVKTKGTVREGINLGGFADKIKLPSGGVILVEKEHSVR